jgi:hypothetical protein
MRLRGDDERVSALAPVVESEETNGDADPVEPVEPAEPVEPVEPAEA